jgi:hypothetical protein
MDGLPVWLASTSRLDLRTGRIAFVPTWSPAWMRDSTSSLYRLLGPLGDRSRERIFRMNVTLCVHRALSREEIAGLPEWFWEGQAEGIAGAPVQVIWESIPGSASTKPCASPERHWLPGYEGDQHGWIPRDCGVCASCLARAAA